MWQDASIAERDKSMTQVYVILLFPKGIFVHMMHFAKLIALSERMPGFAVGIGVARDLN